MVYEKSIFLSDMHIPFENEGALGVVKNFIKTFKPKKIFLLGDLCDFYSVSSFDKDPERINKLQNDLDEGHALLAQIRKGSPKSDIIYLEGNHEHRLQRYLWKHPEIASLKALMVENLLELKKLNIKYKDQFSSVKYHQFLIEHGEIVRQQSAYTTRAMLDKRSLSGISGHTHRMGSHYLTNMSGNYAWFENGCLCKLDPEYVVGQPNWMHGFSIGYFKKESNRFSVKQIPIIKGKACYAGQEFKC